MPASVLTAAASPSSSTASPGSSSAPSFSSSVPGAAFGIGSVCESGNGVASRNRSTPPIDAADELVGEHRATTKTTTNAGSGELGSGGGHQRFQDVMHTDGEVRRGVKQELGEEGESALQVPTTPAVGSAHTNGAGVVQHNPEVKYAPEVSGGVGGSSSAAIATTENEGPKPPSPVVTVYPETYAEEARKRGRAKGRREEEVDVMAGVAYRFAAALASDHRLVLQPDVETPFTDAQDVVRRLLPYHVFMQPRDDMEEMLGRPLSELRGYTAFRSQSLGKGKRKATEEEWMREEIRETRFALDCWRRKTALEKRFWRARIAEGKRLAPDSQAYTLAQAVLETERQEVAALQAEYRASKAELDRVARERKAATVAAATAAASSLAQSTSQASGAANQSTVKFTGSGTATPAKPSSSSAGIPTAARPPPTYGYGYQSGYQQPYMASSSNTTASTPTYAYTNPSSSSVLPSTTMALPSQPIPVTLPVSSLTSLASLGIVPMHPAHAEQQPGPVAAILRGTTQNGTMVSLEINVAALGGAQASGLAVLLGALTSGGVGGGSFASATSGSGSGSGSGTAEK